MGGGIFADFLCSIHHTNPNQHVVFTGTVRFSALVLFVHLLIPAGLVCTVNSGRFIGWLN